METELRLVNQRDSQVVALGVALVDGKVAALHLLLFVAEADGCDEVLPFLLSFQVVLELPAVCLAVHEEVCASLDGDAVNGLHVGDEDRGVDERDGHANHVRPLLSDAVVPGLRCLCEGGAKQGGTEHYP